MLLDFQLLYVSFNKGEKNLPYYGLLRSQKEKQPLEGVGRHFPTRTYGQNCASVCGGGGGGHVWHRLPPVRLRSGLNPTAEPL